MSTNKERAFKLLNEISYVRVAGTNEEERCANQLLDYCKAHGVECEIETFEIDMANIEKATLEVLEKQKLIKERFSEWVWKDEDRRWEIEEAYNKMFRGFDKKHFDGSKLVFPGMNKAFELYDYQYMIMQQYVI